MKLLICIACALLVCSCDLIDYHPYDGRITGEKDLNAKAIEEITERCRNKDTLRFVMMGDTQRWYDETEDFVKDVNSREGIDFIIHGGDISDFGLKKEFQWVRSIMGKLNVPYVALIGNHDVIGNGDQVFQKMYGDPNFAFIAGDTKFVCMNTNAIEYDYSNPIPDFNFLKEQLQDSASHSRTVAVMHAPPGSEQFNNNVKDIFQYSLKQFPNLLFALHAHDHSFKINDYFNDGILYYGCTCMKKRGYYLFTLTPDNYTYEEINF